MATSRVTPYVETEALLAIMEEDRERLAHLLNDMLPGELIRLAQQARSLAYECERWIEGNES